MHVTPEIRDAARRLALHPSYDGTPIPRDDPGHFMRHTLAAPAAFLEAIERLTDEGEHTTAAMGDTTGTPWDAVAAFGHVSVEIGAGVDSSLCVLTPEMAEARGWELIALAHLARAEG